MELTHHQAFLDVVLSRRRIADLHFLRLAALERRVWAWDYGQIRVALDRHQSGELACPGGWYLTLDNAREGRLFGVLSGRRGDLHLGGLVRTPVCRFLYHLNSFSRLMHSSRPHQLRRIRLFPRAQKAFGHVRQFLVQTHLRILQREQGLFIISALLLEHGGR